MKTRLVQNGIFTLVDDVTAALTPPSQGFYWIDAGDRGFGDASASVPFA